MKDDVKVQWLENDVCALTYESPEDDQVHQFVATTETEMKRYLIIMWQMWLMVHGCRKTGEKIISWK